MLRIGTALVVASILITSHALGAQQQPEAAPPVTHAVDPTNFDTTCAPCRDFYRFVNGAWLDRTTIPPEYPRYGVGLEQHLRNQAILYDILTVAAREARTTADGTTQRIGAFYASCMDTTRIDRSGLEPLGNLVRRIDGVQERREILPVLGQLQSVAVDAGLPFFAFNAIHNSSMTGAFVWQGGIGLPDRDFYVLHDTAMSRIRAGYLAHMGRLLTLAGTPRSRAEASARAVLRIETALAEGAQSAAAIREPSNFDHPMTVSALKEAGAALDWTGFFAALETPIPDTVTVATPALLGVLDSLVRVTPLADWRAYFRWRLFSTAAPALGPAFQKEALAYQQLVGGVTQLRPRWQRCVAATDNALGEALGQAYVARTFTPSAKTRVLTMVENLRAVIRDRILALTWMSDSTKQAALAKLQVMTVKIGYPDHWRDYSALHLGPDPYVTNLLKANHFEVARQLHKIGQPVDRSEWGMTPSTVDAYSNPLNIEIVFPAGILQPPLFDPAADDAVNYGSMGAVIGHEITHEFDDQGRLFDAHGNLRNWWTSRDSAEFVQRARLVVDQYHSYVAVDTLHINGQLTLGENIADIGGLIVAYEAWRRSLPGGTEPQAIDGFTGRQRFFIAFASSWRSKERPEALRTRTLSDPHSPAYWRVDGVVQHLAAFHEAFGCRPGDGMYRAPEARMQIW